MTSKRVDPGVLRAFLAPDDAGAVPDGPDPARRAAGRRARERSEALERDLRAEHRAAERAGVAFARQAGRPVIGYGPEGPVYGRAPVDFVGAIRGAPGAPWLPLAVEAKARAERLQRDDVEPHQREHLDATAAAGGVALVVVELRPAGAAGRWAVPWAELEARWARSRGGASVGPRELRGFELAATPYLLRFAGCADA